jgi:penicillin amidase
MGRLVRFTALVLLAAASVAAEDVRLPGLQKPVDVLRDRWGVPHIYAQNANDLFFAQGYIAARDRLFQLDLWRRINTGKLAEVQGPSAIARDRIARLVRYRGDWNAEWTAYSPDARQIAIDFTRGINARIDSLQGAYGIEFRLAGYAPGKWQPEDVVARVAGLLMTRNVAREIDRALDIQEHGVELVQKLRPPDPFHALRIPTGLNINSITAEILRDYSAAIGGARIDGVEGSNNWVIDGSLSVTGKPLLANDPHRPINIPSLRKTVHLVAPGWNVIGAGEPALPGIALGHNEDIAFGFTIVGIDQCDLYVERVNPKNANQYWHKGAWKAMEVERANIAVKGRATPESVELRYTVHGPVLYEDKKLGVAYALRWVGAEPGGAGYLGALALARARNWQGFLKAAANYKVPSENLVYADRAGNIGWLASGAAPIRKGYDGLLPVPGDRGDYDWTGFLPVAAHPQEYNPSRHWIATANANILPKGYPHMLSYEWAQPFRYQRVEQMLRENPKMGIDDFIRMQQDVTNVAGQRFIELLRKLPKPAPWTHLTNWDGRMTNDSVDATIFAVWTARLGEELAGSPLGARVELHRLLQLLTEKPDVAALRRSYTKAIDELQKGLGSDRKQWQWGKVHTVRFEHPLKAAAKHQALLHRGPLPRPGDANTVNAAGGANFRQSSGASYRHIIDVADWDRSVMTNVPGESGDPSSPHYADLLNDWANGRYHPMPYSRPAVEKATKERIRLLPRP